MKVDYPSPRFWIKKTSNATLVRIMEWQLHHRNVVYVKWDSRTRCCILMSQFVRRFLQSQKFSNRTRVQMYVGQDACVKLRAVTRLFLRLTSRGKLRRYLMIFLRYRYFLMIHERDRISCWLISRKEPMFPFIWNVTLWHLNVCKVG